MAFAQIEKISPELREESRNFKSLLDPGLFSYIQSIYLLKIISLAIGDIYMHYRYEIKM